MEAFDLQAAAWPEYIVAKLISFSSGFVYLSTRYLKT